MPKPPAPMLASPAGTLPPLKGWTIEPKWDGIRVVAEVSRKAVQLWSRNGIDKAHQFPEVAEALGELAREHGSLILDGELIAVDRKGKALRFQALQSRNMGKLDDERTGTALVVFDILSAGTKDITSNPWTLRREVLESVVPKSARALIRRGESSPCGSAGAKKLLERAESEGWEGLIVKRMDSAYAKGARSPSWRKVKLEHEQEFVIGGYSLPTEGASRDHIGALLVGHYDAKGKLLYAGKVGTGYTRATLAMLVKKLAPLARVTSPFANAPRTREPHKWVKPVLVAQVRYNEMTESGVLRQPVYLGLRDDKAAEDVRLEEDTSRSAILSTLRCG